MILIIFEFISAVIILFLIIILISTTSHILKNGTYLEEEKGLRKIISKIIGAPMALFGWIMTSFMRLIMWLVETDWFFKGPFRRFLPWLAANAIVKIAYAGEVYTTEETVAFIENIYKKADEREKNGEHLHISISPCICRHATDNWSKDMPNLTCMHFQFTAQQMKKALDQTLLITADTAIHLVKEYASKWPFVHILYGICPSGPEYFD